MTITYDKNRSYECAEHGEDESPEGEYCEPCSVIRVYNWRVVTRKQFLQGIEWLGDKVRRRRV